MSIEEIGAELQQLECRSQALKCENAANRKQLRQAVCARATSPIALGAAALIGVWWGAGHRRAEPPAPPPPPHSAASVGVQTAQTVSVLGVAVTAVKFLEMAGTIFRVLRRDALQGQLEPEMEN